MNDLERIGRHAEAIDNLKTEVSLLREDVAEIKQILAANQGGWKSIVFIGGVASTMGGLAVAVLQWMRTG